MQLARVIGTVVADEKHESLKGIRLLVIEPHDFEGRPDGPPLVAADPLQAGPGDTVEWVTGREAAMGLPDKFAPVDVCIVAIVDHFWGDRRYLE
jgi:ethanolamine utilization protein EutN